MCVSYPRFSALGRYVYDSERFSELNPIYDAKPDCCPYCGCRKLHPYGYIRSNHRHRYRCDNCGKVFADSIGTIYYRGRINQEEVRRACDSMNSQLTVRSLAKEMGVHRNTALRYRRIFLKMVENKAEQPVLGGDDVEIDETYETLSGMRKGDRKFRGISHQKASIAVGIDSKKHLFLSYIGDGHPTTERLKEIWKDRIEKGSTIVHDTLHGYQGVFNEAKPKEEKWIRSTVPEEERLLARLNGMCSGVKWFLRKHRGITKNHLPSYLCWYQRLSGHDLKNPEFEEELMGLLLQKRALASANNT